jgi:hypothetical protein
MNMTEKRAKRESGIDNVLQIRHLPFLAARKTGSSGFPTGSVEPPARSNEPPARSGGFPVGSNALRITRQSRIGLPKPELNEPKTPTFFMPARLIGWSI